MDNRNFIELSNVRLENAEYFVNKVMDYLNQTE